MVILLMINKEMEHNLFLLLGLIFIRSVGQGFQNTCCLFAHSTNWQRKALSTDQRNRSDDPSSDDVSKSSISSDITDRFTFRDDIDDRLCDSSYRCDYAVFPSNNSPLKSLRNK